MTPEQLHFALAVVMPFCAYLLGGISFAYIAGRLFKGIDIREHGSGNPGASNVFRTVGPGPGLLVFALDAGKGALAVYLGELTAHGQGDLAAGWFPVIMGICAAAGHIFTPYLNFRGGKGVAPFLGVLLMVFPFGTGIAAATAFLMIAVFRKFSLGSLVGAAMLPVNYFILKDEPWYPANLPLLILCIAAVVFVYARHIDNLKRLLTGKEHGLRVDAASDEPNQENES